MNRIPKRYSALAVVGLFVWAGSALGQYKSVGPDGAVTYSDRPPPATSRLLSDKNMRTAAQNPALPFGLQQAATKYPVLLYTGDRCGPCDDARTYLRNRGVPFTEKTVTSDDDITQFKQLSSDGTAPLIVVGTRRTTGFSQAVIASLLDSAGYPATSVLPKDYQSPAPTSLAPSTKVPSQPVATQASNRPAPAAPAAAPSAPPGFRF